MKTFKYLLITFLLVSCNEYPKEVKDSLKSAGKNKSELEKVIQHYKNAEDKQKLEAAYFLISNMKGYSSYDKKTYAKKDTFFNMLKPLYNEKKDFMQLPRHEKRKIKEDYREYVKQQWKRYVRENDVAKTQTYYFNDLTTLSSEFLINNIELAFDAWQNRCWGKHISFNDFCNFILPYRCSMTFIDQHREKFKNEYSIINDSILKCDSLRLIADYMLNDINSTLVGAWQLLPSFPFVLPLSYDNIINSHLGSCYEKVIYRVMNLRSNGIPVAFDYVPQWGSTDNKHYWCKVIDHHDDCLLKNDNIPRNSDQRTISIYSTSLAEQNYPLEPFPATHSINYTKKVPKVYRRCFKIQNQSPAAQIKNEAYIPQVFASNRIKDVTAEYVASSNVNINIGKKPASGFAYLCLFQRTGKWKPVAWGKVEGDTVRFKDVGRNILYFPVYFKGNRLIHFSKPFLVDTSGHVKYKTLNNNKMENIKLYRKYPLSIRKALWAHWYLGASFEFANKPDFSDAKTIFTISQTPLSIKEIEINNNNLYRYARIVFPGKREKYISEMHFYGKRNGKLFQLEGKLIGDTGRLGHEMEKFMDNDWNSYYTSSKPAPLPSWVGIDLLSPKKIKKILYAPRSDTNFIMKGDSYELFFWNGKKWVSFGIKTAKKDFLEYKNVPKNVILWLRNHSSGVEERIFTYENGKQIFW